MAALAGLLILSAQAAQAADTTWENTGSGDFFDPDNWSNFYPEPGDSYSIDNGGTAQVTTFQITASYGPGVLGTAEGDSGLLTISGSGGLPVNTLTVGLAGTGFLGVSGGAATDPQTLNLDANNIFLGWAPTGVGEMEVNNGKVSSDVEVIVGAEGKGTLTISNVSSWEGQQHYIGYQAGSEGGTVVNDSVMTLGDDLFVGFEGSGTMQIEGNGIVTAYNATVGMFAGSEGSVTVSAAELTIAPTIPGYGELIVGSAGSGEVVVENSGTLATKVAQIAVQPGSTGSVQLSGGEWVNEGNLTVGDSGNAELKLEAASTLASGTTVLALTAGTTTATVQASTFDVGGDLTIGGAGSADFDIDDSSLKVDDFLTVGDSGNGTLTAVSGASITSATAQLGAQSGSTGEVSLTNSTWETTGDLFIGVLGNGTFTATNSSVEAAVVEIAGSNTSTSSLSLINSSLTTSSITGGAGTPTATMDGATLLLPADANDPTLISGFAADQFELAAGGLTVNTQGAAAVITSPLAGGGGLIKTGAGRIRLEGASTYSGGTQIQAGVLEIVGASALGSGQVVLGTAELRASTDSTLGADIPLFSVDVPENETAIVSAATGQTLTITPQELAFSSDAFLQVGSPGNAGTVVLAPSGAIHGFPWQLHVYEGTLLAANTAVEYLTSSIQVTQVRAGATLDFADHLTGTGIASLGGAGTVHTGSLGDRELVVSMGNFDGDITGEGILVVADYGLITSGNVTVAGGTIVNGGTFEVNGTAGEVTLNTNGTLSGTGTVGTVLLNGGAVSPGIPGGTLTTGDLLWSSGTIVMNLSFDQKESAMLVTESLQGSASSYAFNFQNNGWVEGFTYDLIEFSGTNIDLSQFTYTNGSGFHGDFAFNGNTLQFTMHAIPEPGAACLLAAAGLVALALRRKRVKSHA